MTLAWLMVPQARYPKGPDQTRLYRRLLEGLTERPELQDVGVGFPGPFKATSASGQFYVEGRDAATRRERPFAHLGTVSGGYFAAMGIPLLAGRTFQDRDVENAPPVAIVSAALARKYWPGESPIGKRLRFDNGPTDPWIRVALGAAPRQVLVPMLREGITLALAGIGIGLVGAFLAARTLAAFLFGVGAGDPLTFGGVALLMLVVATLASYIPSRRALRVDPVVALRAE